MISTFALAEELPHAARPSTASDASNPDTGPRDGSGTNNDGSQSGNDGAAGNDATSGGTDASDSGQAHDGGMGSDSGVDGGGASMGAGSVTISQTSFMAAGMTFTSHTLSANFTATGTSAANCTPTTAGMCIIIECAAGTRFPSVSGGNITVSGGMLAQPVTLMPDGANTYQPNAGQGAIFAAGDMFHIVSQGAANGVPMFDQMVTAPTTATVMMPTFMTGHPVTLNRATDLMVAWMHDGNPVGKLNVGLVGPVGGNAPTTVIACRFPVGDASATIPSSTLMHLMPGTGSISISTNDPVDIMPGGFQLELTASSFASAPGGTIASGQTTIQ
jgi:hypothetical protein